MNAMSENVLIASDAETAARAASAALTRQGFRVMHSFDLRSAMAAHADCACPYHGTAQCTCQFIVLLVYCEASPRDGKAGDPVVVTAHSRSDQARLQVVRDEMTCPDPQLAAQVMSALVEARVTLQAAAMEEVVANAA